MPDEREPPAPTDTPEPAGEPAASPEVSPEELAKRKDLEAWFEALYRKHYKKTVAGITRMGFLKEEARQLAQDTFFRVYRNMEKFGGEIQEEWAYVWETARNLAWNAFRDEKTQKRFSERVSMTALPSPANIPSRNLFTGLPPSSGEDYTQRRETIQRLIDAIRELPENLQRPLWLRIRSKPYNEIAAELDLTEEAVRARLRDARRRLRKKLAEEPAGIDWPEDPSGGPP